MDGKAKGRWLGTSPYDDGINIALTTNAFRAYEGKPSELIPPGPWSRVGTVVKVVDHQGSEHPVHLPVTNVPGLGRHLFQGEQRQPKAKTWLSQSVRIRTWVTSRFHCAETPIVLR